LNSPNIALTTWREKTYCKFKSKWRSFEVKLVYEENLVELKQLESQLKSRVKIDSK